MKYYRVIKEKYDYFNKNMTIMNELLTPRERNTMFRYLGDDCFEEVEVSRKKTYISFGARFEIGTDHNGIRKENKMKAKRVFDIMWDTDGEDINLPKEIILSKDIDNDDIADYLSDEYGFCIFSFKLEYIFI